MKLNKKLITELRNGEISVENIGALEQLKEVLKAAFPNSVIPTGSFRYYSRSEINTNAWRAYSFKDKGKPTFKISDFYQPELFTGWAKDDNYPGWMVYFKKDIPTFGFDSLGVWQESDSNFNYSKDEGNRPATNEEIEKALIKEAKSRGYKGGNTIKGIRATMHFPEEISFRYEREKNRLVTNKYCVVFENGQWAINRPE